MSKHKLISAIQFSAFKPRKVGCDPYPTTIYIEKISPHNIPRSLAPEKKNIIAIPTTPSEES